MCDISSLLSVIYCAPVKTCPFSWNTFDIACFPLSRMVCCYVLWFEYIWSVVQLYKCRVKRKTWHNYQWRNETQVSILPTLDTMLQWGKHFKTLTDTDVLANQLLVWHPSKWNFAFDVSDRWMSFRNFCSMSNCWHCCYHLHQRQPPPIS